MKVIISNRQRKLGLPTARIKKDCLKALAILGLEHAELSIAFLSPEKTRALNNQYRGIDRTTDVLSFPLYESPDEFPDNEKFLLGDIVIDPLRAAQQAADYGSSLEDEIRRLLIHGLLHLVGYDHEAGAVKRKKMKRREMKLLSLLA